VSFNFEIKNKYLPHFLDKNDITLMVTDLNDTKHDEDSDI